MPDNDSFLILLVAALLSAALLVVGVLARRQQRRIEELRRRIAERNDRSAAEAAELRTAREGSVDPHEAVAGSVATAEGVERPVNDLNRWIGFVDRRGGPDSADVVRRATIALGAGERNRYLAAECPSDGIIADRAGHTDFAQILVDTAVLLEPTHAY